MIVAIPLLAMLAQAQPVDTTRKTTLPTVSVEAEALKPARYNATTKFDEFYRRRARGLGKFFTREDLERSRATAAANMLVGLGGIIVYPPHAGQKPIIKLNRCIHRNGLALFIDGNLVPNTRMTPAETLFEFHVNDIEAMEVYPSQNQLPQEAVGSGCAAVFLWTRYSRGSVLAKKPEAVKPTAQPAAQTEWPQHSLARPQPTVVTPPALTLPAPPPEGAVVLFDGTSLANWRKKGSDAPASWKVENGYMEIVPGAGDIESLAAFGDARVHVEFMIPASPDGTGQDRGNSGVFLMGIYEVQVLDSYQSTTYPDGQNAALFGDAPPSLNASLPPGQWQSFDISFRAARFDADGKLVLPTLMTVYHNGVKVHDNVAVRGPTAFQRRAPYVAHPMRLPMTLQEHGHPVRFRNIWVKEL